MYVCMYECVCVQMGGCLAIICNINWLSMLMEMCRLDLEMHQIAAWVDGWIGEYVNSWIGGQIDGMDRWVDG